MGFGSQSAKTTGGGVGTGTVTSVSGVTANGFTWSIPNSTTTPTITLTLQDASGSQSGQLNSTDWNTFNGKQAALSGTGFVKSTAGVISYDTNTYLTTGTAASTYAPINNPTFTGTVTLAADPVSGLQATTKSYVDNLLTGITWKQEVKAATTANITLSGAQTIDGIALIAGDRCLVKNQTSAIQNGIYLVAGGAWTRTTDADTTAEIETATVFIRLGTVNADTQWTCTNSNEPVIGVDNITFGQIAGAGTYTNGSGITLTGNTFSIAAGAITNAMLAGSIDLTSKVTGILPSANGGTGVNNAGTLTNASNTTITGGGTIALGGFTATIPATGTVTLGSPGAAARVMVGTSATACAGSSTLNYGSNQLSNNTSFAGQVDIICTNSSSNVAGYASSTVSNGTKQIQMITRGTSFATAGLLVAGLTEFESTSTVGTLFANTAASTKFWWANGGTGAANEVMRLTTGLSIGTQADPTAILHLKAGTTTANTAPIQINNGTRETTARGGLVEYENSFYNTNNNLVRYGLGGTIKDFLTDVATTTSTSETDIYTFTTIASTLAVNGDKIDAEYGLQLTSTGGITKQVRAYFAGTLIFDSGVLSISASTDFCLDLFVIRDSSTTVRCIAKANTTGAATNAFAKVTKITGLTLSNTNILKVTGTVGAGAVAGDITGICGMIEVKSAA